MTTAQRNAMAVAVMAIALSGIFEFSGIAGNLPAAAQSSTWDFCTPTITLSGCKCHPSWSYNGTTYYGTCASDNDPRGSWCVVDKATCPTSYRAHERGIKDVINATVNGAAANLTGLDFDYCQTTTINNCHCSSSWSYNGSRYGGTCRTGLLSGAVSLGMEEDVYWCQVGSCRSAS